MAEIQSKTPQKFSSAFSKVMEPGPKMQWFLQMPPWRCIAQAPSKLMTMHTRLQSKVWIVEKLMMCLRNLLQCSKNHQKLPMNILDEIIGQKRSEEQTS